MINLLKKKMMNDFKKGDSVSVLDEDLSGIVTKVTTMGITFETEDGFLLTFQPKELVKLAPKNTLNSSNIFQSSSLSNVILEKAELKRKPAKKIKAKERYQPIMEIDLHINKLVKSSKGMSNFDMLTLQLETAKRQLDFAINKRIQRIVFIHGVGEGVLKLELEYLFNRYDNIKYYEANYQKYGLGATEVYIYQSKN